ncbi:hypothetical protein DFH11DRAFT_1692428 [Phellopilus nigrolimitatus]|nr:hypothetical protein DFH11DRAFT_1692428 [Phellopilus nigrolimitatus]
MSSYVIPRAALYALLWASSIVELGLTGYHVRHTKTSAGFYDPIVVELLVTAALTLIWIPITVFAHVRKAKSLHGGSGYAPLHGESAGNFVVWVMYLVGGAIATHKWPSPAFAGAGKEGHVLLSIVAFAWIPFGVLSLVKVFTLMQYAALKAESHSSHAPINEKAGNGNGNA